MKDENAREVLLGCAPIIIFILPLFLIVFCLTTLPEESETITKEYKLVSLRDGTRLSGSGGGNLFFVSINITEEEYYTFYYKLDEEGSYKLGEISSKNVTITEKPSVATPRLLVYSPCKVLNTEIVSIDDDPDKARYEFIVPEGTIVQNFLLGS